MRAESAIVAAYNDKSWDEFGRLYAEDALMMPPNHEPLRGRDAIIRYISSVRDVFGEIDRGYQHLRAKGSGEPDGSVLLAVDQIGFDGQAVG